MHDVRAYFFQPISYGVVLLVFELMSLGRGTQSLDLQQLSLDNISVDFNCLR